MIFLLPIIFVIIVIFRIDYLYFSEENKQIINKNKELNESLEKQKQEFIEKIFKNKS